MTNEQTDAILARALSCREMFNISCRGQDLSEDLVLAIHAKNTAFLAGKRLQIQKGKAFVHQKTKGKPTHRYILESYWKEFFQLESQKKYWESTS